MFVVDYIECIYMFYTCYVHDIHVCRGRHRMHIRVYIHVIHMLYMLYTCSSATPSNAHLFTNKLLIKVDPNKKLGIVSPSDRWCPLLKF